MSFYVKANAAEAINAELNMTNSQTSKSLFVKKELSAAVTKANSDIRSLEYWVCNGEEYVSIHYNNGHEATVCITADSLAAAALDVFKYVVNH